MRYFLFTIMLLILPLSFSFAVEVDIQVFMTHSAILSNNDQNNKSIGTDGLENCLGIIAIYENGDVFCGHLSNEKLITRRTTQDKLSDFRTQIRTVLSKNMKHPENSKIKKIYISSGNKKMISSTEMIMVLLEMFQGVPINDAMPKPFPATLENLSQDLKSDYLKLVWDYSGLYFKNGKVWKCSFNNAMTTKNPAEKDDIGEFQIKKNPDEE